jgi:exodeoxyribonuclease VII large subunit
VLVTSPTGAAVRDFIQVATRKWPLTEILIAPAKVQGEGAAQEIAQAIGLANRVADVDFVVLARGGGSLEDLWAFNEEVVARAIFGSRLPVVSAIGHEVDVTVSDLVADVRALTPTDAANRCVPDIDDLRIAVDELGARMARSVVEPVARAKMKLANLAERSARALSLRVERSKNELERLSDRLNKSMQSEIDRRRQSLANQAATIEALSPLKVLARGYSLTLKEDGKTVVRTSTDVTTGETIETRLGTGTIKSRVL